MYQTITLSEKKHKALQKLVQLDEKVLETLASIAIEDLKRLGEAVEKNPKIVKNALKFV